MYSGIIMRYRRRWIRRKRLWQAFRSRHQLTLTQDNRATIPTDAILGFTTLRNEIMRLPFFLEHYRRLGVGHFFIVDNGSDDGSAEYLRAQKDVSLWHTTASYRGSRFGVDWLNWLKMKHAHGHWVVVVDADETLIYPKWETRDLKQLTDWLDDKQQQMMGAMMLDMYPKGSPDAQSYSSGEDPFQVLNWFDAHGYWVQHQHKLDNFWLQGGVRARCFFADDPARAPTLNKVPLVRWKRGYAFVNSTHSALPSRLNHTVHSGGVDQISGVLLHSKFLPGTAMRAIEEKDRDEHFQAGTRYGDYYDSLADSPDLWCPESTCFEGWQQLCELGLMSRGDW
ncbi:MAG: glycosyltransferase family 2 protein [Aliishimia sp.]